MKAIEQPNPFTGSVTGHPVVRETRTQYVTAYARYRKPQYEYNGCLVRPIGAGRWDAPSILRITKDKEK